MRQIKPNRHRAFTLVEILVVIGIIALLIAILLPSLNRAREQSYRIACASNLRQIATATHIYAQGNKGLLPRTHYEVDKGLLNSNKGGRGNSPFNNPFDSSNPVGSNNVGASMYLLLREGLLVPDSFRCPSNTVAEKLDKANILDYSNFPTPMRKYNSYSFIAAFPSSAALASGWKLKLSVMTTQYPIASDINPGKGGSNFTDRTGQDVTSIAHTDSSLKIARANSNNHKNVGQQVAYADGHVEWCETPFCGPAKPGRAWRDNIFANTKGVDQTTGKGGTVHTQPQEQTDVVLHPGDGAS